MKISKYKLINHYIPDIILEKFVKTKFSIFKFSKKRF